MGPIGRAALYRTLKINFECYQNHKKRKADALYLEDDKIRQLGWEQASVAILEHILTYVDELIENDDEVNELIKRGDVRDYV